MTSVSSKHRIVLEMSFSAPSRVDRSEFTSGCSLQLSISYLYVSKKKDFFFLPREACSCDCTQVELMRTLLR